MSYLDDEQSLDSGQPVELYCFKQGSVYYTYNSSGMSVDYGGKTYIPGVIGRGDIELSTNSMKNVVNIDMDRLNDFASQFLTEIPEKIIELTIYRGHGTNPSNFVSYWNGYVSVIKITSKIITVTASPKLRSLRRSGLMRKYQRTCSYPLYSERCTVVKSSYEREGTVTNVDGRQITADIFGTEADEWFTGGSFEIDDKSRLITWHEGTVVILSRSIKNLSVGDSFFAYAGCDHSPEICLSKFSNKVNFGGQEFIPNINIFVSGV